MDDSSEEFQRLTRELQLRMRDSGIVGSVFGYATGFYCSANDPVDEAQRLRWYQLWNRLGRPFYSSLP